MTDQDKPKRPPGTAVTWEEKRKEFPKITGDEELIERVWEDCDAMAYMYIWQVLVSF